MCGISGIFHFHNQETVNEKTLVAMRETLVHRGPDDAGLFISPDRKLGFGFRRLSIIDLSPSGHQPMESNDRGGKIVAMLNGEIYNYQSLRRELEKKDHAFKSQSDTEVILHSYEEKSTHAVHDWNGMFAVALYDEKKQKLWLVRDRLGIKPLYYATVDGTLIFASEIKALLAYPGMRKKLNREALFHYLTFACVPAPLTLFEGIRKLPAGWMMEVDENGVKERQYWDAAAEKHGAKTEEFFTGKIRELLKNSIEQQMVSDVPFGVFLSGGIDSSTNVALMTAARGKPVDSFSVNIKDLPRYDEFSYARKVAQIFNSNHHETTAGFEEMMQFLPKLAHHADDPNGDPVCFPLFYVSKLIRENGVIMAQVGEGADELFAGYNQYQLVLNFWKRWWRRLEGLPRPLRTALFEAGKLTRHPARHLHREHLRRLAAAEEFFWGGAIAFTEFEKESLLTKNFHAGRSGISSFNAIQPHYKKIDEEAPETDFLNRMIYLELKLRLPELLLMRVDKITMAHSLEARVPFLDHRLVELALSIPMDLKLKNGVTKYALKEAVRGIIPDEIIERKKQGFAAPVCEWLRDREKAAALLKPMWQSKMWDEDIFEKSAVEKLIADHQNGKADLSFKIWNLITLGLWFDRWM